jgi:hypothetical protein
MKGRREVSQESGCRVAGFVSALRQFATYLEKEPELALFDADGDFFVACSDLIYDDGFDRELKQQMRNLVEMVGVRKPVHWWMIVCGWMAAVASYACRESGGEVEESDDGKEAGTFVVELPAASAA